VGGQLLFLLPYVALLLPVLDRLPSLRLVPLRPAALEVSSSHNYHQRPPAKRFYQGRPALHPRGINPHYPSVDEDLNPAHLAKYDFPRHLRALAEIAPAAGQAAHRFRPVRQRPRAAHCASFCFQTRRSIPLSSRTVKSHGTGTLQIGHRDTDHPLPKAFRASRPGMKPTCTAAQRGTRRCCKSGKGSRGLGFALKGKGLVFYPPYGQRRTARGATPAFQSVL